MAVSVHTLSTKCLFDLAPLVVVLGALLRTSPVFASIRPLPSEVSIVKALRAHAEDAFDNRMIMVNTARSTRSASETGGYELRRRDWQSVLQQFHTFDRKYWHLRTIYIVFLLLSSPYNLH